MNYIKALHHGIARLDKLSLCMRIIKECHESSKVDERRHILNFLFSNLEMKDKKAIITLREPFDKLVAVSDHPKCRETWDGLRTFPWREFGSLLEEMIPFAA